jgi:hypothetical protein
VSAAPEVDPGRGPAAHGRSRSAREVSGILAAAARAGWHDRGRILAVAMVVSVATAGAEIIADHIFDPANNALSVVGTLSVEVISLLGTILISGFLCRLVGRDHRGRPGEDRSGDDRPGRRRVREDRSGEYRASEVTPAQEKSGEGRPDPDPGGEGRPDPNSRGEGRPDPDPRGEEQGGEEQGSEKQGGEKPVTVGQVVRTLPWARLVAADILVAVLLGIGLLALVVPGLVILNLCAVVGPVIEIERRSVLGSLRRSAHLVRLHFWWVGLLITVPVAALGEIESLLPDPHGLPAILEVLAARGIGEALAETVIGLIVVQVCFWLIDLDTRPYHPPRPPRESRPEPRREAG